VYLILLGLAVPALTFSGLWFWRLRHQRRGSGHLTESEMAAMIAARQAELQQQREARDEQLAGVVVRLLQSTAGTRSDVHAIQDAVERALRK
jgi:flagellar biosynthesis/type III secretory pathway protein FliH